MANGFEVECQPLHATVEWAAALPAHLRPQELLRWHPAIADRLALEWDDPASTQFNLKELLLAPRGGRPQLSREVRDELQALRRFCAVRLQLTPPAWLVGRNR